MLSIAKIDIVFYLNRRCVLILPQKQNEYEKNLYIGFVDFIR